MTYDRQFDKEGKKNFRDKENKRKITTFLERELVVF